MENHLKQLVSVDFFMVPTVSFRILSVFFALARERRRAVHCIATEHPTAEWTSAQLMQAFPQDTAPRYLLRGRDQICGDAFRGLSAGMAITEVLTRTCFALPLLPRTKGCKAACVRGDSRGRLSRFVLP